MWSTFFSKKKHTHIRSAGWHRLVDKLAVDQEVLRRELNLNSSMNTDYQIFPVLVEVTTTLTNAHCGWINALGNDVKQVVDDTG